MNIFIFLKMAPTPVFPMLEDRNVLRHYHLCTYYNEIKRYILTTFKDHYLQCMKTDCHCSALRIFDLLSVCEIVDFIEENDSISIPIEDNESDIEYRNLLRTTMWPLIEKHLKLSLESHRLYLEGRDLENYYETIGSSFRLDNLWGRRTRDMRKCILTKANESLKKIPVDPIPKSNTFRVIHTKRNKS